MPYDGWHRRLRNWPNANSSPLIGVKIQGDSQGDREGIDSNKAVTLKVPSGKKQAE